MQVRCRRLLRRSRRERLRSERRGINDRKFPRDVRPARPRAASKLERYSV